LLVKFRIVIDINVSIGIQTLVGISIHAKSILARVINVVETDVYVWDMSNLVQGQYSVDALFHGSLNVTAPIFQGLGILRKWFREQKFSRKREKHFDVTRDCYLIFLLISKSLLQQRLPQDLRGSHFGVPTFTQVFFLGLIISCLSIEEIAGAVNARLNVSFVG
jgi:hypothetical protein